MPAFVSTLTLPNSAAPPSGAQLITGDTVGFEGGTEGIWAIVPAAATGGVSAVQAHSGTNSLNIILANSTTGLIMANTSRVLGTAVAITAGALVTATMWVYNPAGTTKLIQYGLRFFSAAAARLDSSANIILSAVAGVWTQVTITGSAPATSAYLSFLFFNDGTTSDSWFVDDLSITALAVGTEYFDTTLRQVGVFNGTNWQYESVVPFARGLMLSLL